MYHHHLWVSDKNVINLFVLIYVGHRWIQNAHKVPDVPLGNDVRTRIKQFSLMNKFKKKVLGVSLFSNK